MRLKNTSDQKVVFPGLNVEIQPGEEADVPVPDWYTPIAELEKVTDGEKPKAKKTEPDAAPVAPEPPEEKVTDGTAQ